MGSRDFLTDTTAPVERAMPWSPQAEQAVLGSMLAYNPVCDEISTLLRADEFYTLDHQLIYRAIMALVGAHKPADPITVGEYLQGRGELERIDGGIEYIVEVSQYGSPTSARTYAEIVHERAIVRALISTALKIEKLAYETAGKTPQAILGQAQELLAQVDARTRHGEATFRPLSEALTEVFATLEDDAAHPGLTTGFADLDARLNPMQPGQLIIIGARPAVGKTSLAVNIAEHVEATYKVNVGMFSMEMTQVEIALRVLSGATNIPAGRFREHRLEAKHWERMQEAMNKLAASRFYIDETGGLTIQEITARARLQAKRIGGFGLLVVDYVQLAHAEGRYDNRAVEIGAVTRGLKQLAKELQCPVIALSQLNREAAKERKLPTIAELRDSGSIESDADTILLLHREYVATQNDNVKHDAMVIIGKQRNGGIGKVDLDYDARLTKFFNAGESPARRIEDARNYSAAKGV